MLRVLTPLALLILALPVGAEACVPTTSQALADTGGVAPGHRHYVVKDDCPEALCGLMYWVYAEANGIDGLQRRDEMRDDTCGGQIDADSVIF